MKTEAGSANKRRGGEVSLSERDESQWVLIWREFRKRRMAVLAAGLLAMLAGISIFAPFLANDRPIYYRGFNRFEYDEARRNVRALLGLLADTQETNLNDDQVTALTLQVDLMADAADDKVSGPLREFQNEIETALALDPDQRSETLKTLRNRWRAEFSGSELPLTVKARWPVFASLNWLEVWFMVGALCLLTWTVLGRLFARLSPQSRSLARLVVLLVVPSVVSFVWWLAVPERLDRSPYKRGVIASSESASNAPVVYETVLWPPIAYGLDEAHLDAKSLPPAWMELKEGQKVPARSTWEGVNWLGTDEIGRDVLCRMIWGGRVSLSVGIVAVSIYVVIGVIVGAIAGYFRGFADLVISRIIEIVICFPAFFLILTIVALRGPSIFNIMIIIGLTSWTGIARLVRGEFLRLVDQEFVLAGRALGFSPSRIIFRHVLPNAMAPVMVAATFGVAGAILTESALSFLGLGITAPTPSWGGILASGRDAMFRAPWLIHFPGLVIFLTITSCNLVGETLRDASDPRLRGSRA
jgi:peptide/nickel transport system permease protein